MPLIVKRVIRLVWKSGSDFSRVGSEKVAGLPMEISRQPEEM